MNSHSGPLLEARRLELWRGDRRVLRNVSFELAEGELLQVIGPNGVGKTSLLRVVCGLLPAESGEVFWRGMSIQRRREAFHSELAYLAHANALKNELSSLENLKFGVALRLRASREQCTGALERSGIRRCSDLPGRALSAGQRRRLALARVLLWSATLWILDEPSTNLDRAGFALVEQLIAAHLDAGGAVLAAAHQPLLPGRARQLELA